MESISLACNPKDFWRPINKIRKITSKIPEVIDAIGWTDYLYNIFPPREEPIPHFADTNDQILDFPITTDEIIKSIKKCKND